MSNGQAKPKITRGRFLLRFVAVVMPLALFQVGASQALIYQVMHPTLKDTWLMLNLPGPVVALFLAVFYVLVYLYLRPVLQFLAGVSEGKPQTADFLKSIQDRAVAFPYFMALLAFPFYMVGSSVATYIICVKLGWPMETIIYGFLSGLISSLLATPIAIYGYSWQIEPALELSTTALPGLEPARQTGQKIMVMAKLLITVLSLMIAVTGYTAVVGYKQTRNLFDNMARMEQMLPAAERANLVNSVEKTIDPRAKSAAYFSARMGNLSLFYVALLAAAILISGLMAVAAGLYVARPIRSLKKSALRAREGNYEEPVRLVSNDEFSEVGASFNQMMDTIMYQIQFTQDMADNLKNGIVKIDETVNTMAAVSDRQSRGAAEQASALEETTATSQTIADTAREIAERALLVDRAASHTISSSQDGKTKLELSRKEFSAIAGQMETISSGMAELDSKFREIYEVAALIKDMSARTEILSLNAGIEAAAAGTEGRRFMVVAEETRLLSARSGEAAVKIRDLVGSIQKAALQSMTVTEAGKAKVVAGTRTIESALETLKTISSSAQSTFAAVKEITGSASSQRLASEQVATSVAQIYTVAKQVEKGTMEINSAITGLQKFAEALRKTVKGNTAA